jgi:uridine kinase
MNLHSYDELETNIRTLAQTKPHILVAIDGPSGAGKTTISARLGEALSAAVIEADDFYSGGSHADWIKRTPQERADLCIDWKRLRQEALTPLLAGRLATWHPFDWDTESDLSTTPTTRNPAPVVILDGAFSSRPELQSLIDYSVLVIAPDDVRRLRLEQREGTAYMSEWYPLWREAEDYYYSHVRPAQQFDSVM